MVHRKEGKAKATGDLYDIWNGKEEDKDLTLYCNNILQLQEHFIMLCKQAREGKFRVDWNQGLDIRLVTSEVASELKSISHVKYHFAFDSLKIEKQVRRGLKCLEKVGIKQHSFFTLIGFDESLEEDIYRLELLKSMGQRPYVMRYKKVDPEMPDGMITEENEVVYNAIARWGNNSAWYGVMNFAEWIIGNEDNIHRYKAKFEALGLWDKITKGV